MILKNKVFWCLTVILIIFVYIIIFKVNFNLSKDYSQMINNIGYSYIAAYVFYFIQQFIPETIKKHNAYCSIIGDVEDMCSSIEMLLCLNDNCLSLSNDNKVKIKKREIYCRLEDVNSNNAESAWAKHLILPSSISELKKSIINKITGIKNHPFYINTEVSFIKTLETIDRDLDKFTKGLEFEFKYELKNSINNEIGLLSDSLRKNVDKIYKIFKSRKIVVKKYYELTEAEVLRYNEIMESRMKGLPEELENMAYICIKRENNKAQKK